ncbi:MAG: YqgE/AlgH family protein [Bacteroidales bacterium]|nr:YqgE/AlgH family protein [Bacteroidales bacterium]
MNRLDKILSIHSNGIKPAVGKVLISEPFQSDFYFKRSVVLLAEHTEEGSFGLIMNKPLDLPFKDVVKGFPDFDGRVFIGGPVKVNNVYFLHSLGHIIEGSLKIIPGLFWGGDADQIREMILKKQIKPSEIMFFVGYSGWSSQQLETELNRNAWLVSSTNADIIKNVECGNLWSHMLTRLGGKYVHWKNYPIDPLSN